MTRLTRFVGRRPRLSGEHGQSRLPLVASMATVRTCRTCGCTDSDCRQCIERTGKPCHWIAPDLCSACAGEAA
jgi:hypothetical protein